MHPTAAFPAIPGPPPALLLGSAGNLFRFLRDPVAYMCDAHRRYGTIAAFVHHRPGMVFAFGPAFNQQILGNPRLFHSTGLSLPGPPGSAQRRLGNGLFRMNDDAHQSHRRLVMPPFCRRAVDGYRDAVAGYTERFLETWRDRPRLDIASEMRCLSLRIAGPLLFGVHEHTEQDTLSSLLRRWAHFNRTPVTRLCRLDWPGTPYRAMLSVAREVECHIRALIDTKRRQSVREHDVLSILIRAHDEDGSVLTDDELVGHAAMLFSAAHDTTANTLAWTLLALAQHPEIAADVVDELTSVLGGQAPSSPQMTQLPLLDAVIKESMRILPTVVYNTRRSVAPFELGPYELPSGSTVAFSHYVTHHLPELYPEPERFNPARWSGLDPSPYEYLPFGSGPRMCIGASFAGLILRVVLATMLQRFRFSVVPGARIDRRVDLTMSPSPGLPMEVVAQDRRFAAVPISGNIREMMRMPC